MALAKTSARQECISYHPNAISSITLSLKRDIKSHDGCVVHLDSRFCTENYHSESSTSAATSQMVAFSIRNEGRSSDQSISDRSRLGNRALSITHCESRVQSVINRGSRIQSVTNRFKMATSNSDRTPSQDVSLAKTTLAELKKLTKKFEDVIVKLRSLEDAFRRKPMVYGDRYRMTRSKSEVLLRQGRENYQYFETVCDNSPYIFLQEYLIRLDKSIATLEKLHLKHRIEEVRADLAKCRKPHQASSIKSQLAELQIQVLTLDRRANQMVPDTKAFFEPVQVCAIPNSVLSKSEKARAQSPEDCVLRVEKNHSFVNRLTEKNIIKMNLRTNSGVIKSQRNPLNDVMVPVLDCTSTGEQSIITSEPMENEDVEEVPLEELPEEELSYISVRELRSISREHKAGLDREARLVRQRAQDVADYGQLIDKAIANAKPSARVYTPRQTDLGIVVDYVYKKFMQKGLVEEAFHIQFFREYSLHLILTPTLQPQRMLKRLDRLFPKTLNKNYDFVYSFLRLCFAILEKNIKAYGFFKLTINYKKQDMRFLSWINNQCPKLKYHLDNSTSGQNLKFKKTHNQVRAADDSFKVTRRFAYRRVPEFAASIKEQFDNNRDLYINLKIERPQVNAIVLQDGQVCLIYNDGDNYRCYCLCNSVLSGVVDHMMSSDDEIHPVPREYQDISDSGISFTSGLDELTASRPPGTSITQALRCALPDDPIDVRRDNFTGPQPEKSRLHSAAVTFAHVAKPSYARSLLNNVLPEVPRMCSEARETLECAKATFKNVDASLEGLKNLFCNVKDTKFKFLTMLDAGGLLGKILAGMLDKPWTVFHMLSTFPSPTNSLGVTRWVGAFFESFAPDHTFEFTAIISLVVTSVNAFRNQMEVQEHAVMDDIVTPLISMLSVIILPFSAVSLSGAGFVKMLMGFNACTMALVNTDRAYNVVSKIITNLLKMSGILPELSQVESDVRTCGEDLEKWTKKYAERRCSVFAEGKSVESIIKLYSRILQLHRHYAIANDRNKQATMNYLSWLVREAKLFHDSVVTLNAMRIPRPIPMCFMVFGAKQSGKSYFIEELAQDLCKEFNYDAASVDWGSAYWPGYNGQEIVKSDDMFNNKTNPGEYITNFLQAISISPFLAPGAAIEDKKQPFRGRIVMASKQNWDMEYNAVDNSAVERRIDLNMEFYNPDVDYLEPHKTKFDRVQIFIRPRFKPGSMENRTGLMGAEVKSFTIRPDGTVQPQFDNVAVTRADIVRWVRAEHTRQEADYQRRLKRFWDDENARTQPKEPEDHMGVTDMVRGVAHAVLQTGANMISTDDAQRCIRSSPSQIYGPHPIHGATFITIQGVSEIGKDRFCEMYCSKLGVPFRSIPRAGVNSFRNELMYKFDCLNSKQPFEPLPTYIILSDFSANPSTDRQEFELYNKFYYDCADIMVRLGAKVVMSTINYLGTEAEMGARRRRGEIWTMTDQGFTNLRGRTLAQESFEKHIAECVSASRRMRARFETIGLVVDENTLQLSSDAISAFSKCSNEIMMGVEFARYRKRGECSLPAGRSATDFLPLLKLFKTNLWKGNPELALDDMAREADFSALPEDSWQLAVSHQIEATKEGGEPTQGNFLFRIVKDRNGVTIFLNDKTRVVFFKEKSCVIRGQEIPYTVLREKMDDGEDVYRGLPAYDKAMLESRILLTRSQLSFKKRFLGAMLPVWVNFYRVVTHEYFLYGMLISAATISGVALTTVLSRYFHTPKAIKAHKQQDGQEVRIYPESVPIAGDTIEVEGNSLKVVSPKTQVEPLTLTQDQYLTATLTNSIVEQSYVPRTSQHRKEHRPVRTRAALIHEMSLDPSTDGIIAKIKGNVVSVFQKIGPNNEHIVFATGLIDRYLTTVGHLWKKDGPFYVVNQHGDESRIERVYNFPDRDLCLCRCVELSFPLFKKIDRFLIPDGSVEHVKNVMAFIPQRVKHGLPKWSNTQVVNSPSRFYSRYISKENVIVMQDFKIERTLPFTRGDCGLPYIALVKGSPVIVGFHVAGHTDHFALGTTISLEHFRDLITTLAPPITSPLIEHLQQPVVDHMDIIFEPHGIVFSLQDADEEYVGHLPVMGRVRPLFQPTKTAIVKPATHNKIFKTQMAPAVLSDAMLKKRVEAYGPPTRDFPQDLVDEVVLEMVEGLRPIASQLRLLTDEEVLNGYDRLPPVDRSTSLGYAWASLTKEGGKKDVLENINGHITWKETILAEEIQRHFCSIVDSAKNRERVMSIASFTLKDETRPHEKVFVNPKTRVFQANDFTMVCFSRMVWGTFINALLNERELTSCKVGINYLSFEWDVMLSEAWEKGDHGFDGDFSDFDSAQKQQLILAVFEIFRRLCKIAKWSKQQLNMVDVLEENIIYTTLVVGNLVVQKRCGNPSGWAGTTILNSLVNEIIMLVTWKALANRNGYADRSRANYRHKNYLAVFGDDNFVIPNPETEWYNHNTVSAYLAEFDMKYTTSDKTLPTGDVPMKPLVGGISFLKRKFVFDDGTLFAPLELASILERFNWCKEGQTEGDLFSNLTETFVDLAMHPKNIYDAVRRRFREFLHGHMHYTQFRPPSWARARNIVINRKFESVDRYLISNDEDSALLDIENGMYLIVKYKSEKESPGEENLNYVQLPLPPLTSELVTAEGLEKESKYLETIMAMSDSSRTNHSVVTEENLSKFADLRIEDQPIIDHMGLLDDGNGQISATDRQDEIANRVSASFTKLAPDMQQVISRPLIDESSIMSSPNYITTFNYNASDIAGKVLWFTRLNPRSFASTHIEYLSRIHMFYVGSFCFHFSLVSNDWHSGKLMFVYVADPNFVPKTQSLQFYTQYKKMIVDIKTHQVIDVDIPYTSTQRALFLDSNIPELSTTGWMVVVAYSPLSAPTTVSQTVPINVMVSMTPGSHFEGIKNVPEVSSGGGIDSAAVFSSLIAPTPLYAPVESQVSNLAEVPYGKGPGDYKYWQANSQCYEGLDRIRRHYKGEALALQDLPIVSTFPVVYKNGTTVSAPTSADYILETGLINCARFRMDVSVSPYIESPTVSSTPTDIIANLNDTSQLFYHNTAFVVRQPWGGDPVCLLNFKASWWYQIGTGTVNWRTNAVDVFTNYPTNNFIWYRVWASSIPTAGQKTIVIAAEEPDAAIFREPYSAGSTWNSYGIAMDAMLAGGNDGILQPVLYSKWAIENATMDQKMRGATPYTGAVVSVAEPSTVSDGSVWDSVLSAVVKGVGYIGDIIEVGSTALSWLSPVLRTEVPLVFDLRTVGTLKYETVPQVASQATLSRIQDYLLVVPSIIAASNAERNAIPRVAVLQDGDWTRSEETP